jgi:transcriptional regulator with XRE-family HTH domain
MTLFQTGITPSRRIAARFVTGVRRSIQKALAEEGKKSGTTQSDIARAIGVHRSVVNRELRGQKDLTLGRVAELCWALGRTPSFSMPEITMPAGANIPLARPQQNVFTSSTKTNLDAVVLGEFKAGATTSGAR